MPCCTGCPDPFCNGPRCCTHRINEQRLSGVEVRQSELMHAPWAVGTVERNAKMSGNDSIFRPFAWFTSRELADEYARLANSTRLLH